MQDKWGLYNILNSLFNNVIEGVVDRKPSLFTTIAEDAV